MYDPTKPYRSQLLEMIKETWDTEHVRVRKSPRSPYPEIDRRFHSSIEIDHTDGIGTKGIYHWEQRTFKAAAQDAFAMNLNDLAMARAAAYTLQNHIILPQDDKEAIFEIVSHLAALCKEHDIALTGGETSIMNNIRGMDLSVTVRGVRQANEEMYTLSNIFTAGDVLIGIPSSGLHSNGFTKVREVLGDTFRQEYVEPTRIYWRDVHKAQLQNRINGMSHITGGAFTKMKDFLQEVDAVITRAHLLEPHPIYFDLHQKGVGDEEMYRTFNCGIGFVLSVRQYDSQSVCESVGGQEIGRVEKGNGMVRIESKFSDIEVTL